jgi:fatty acid desaturase
MMSSATAFPIDELRRFSRVSNLRSALDIAATWGVIVAALLLAERVDRWWAYAAAALVVGSRQSALANLAHDAWHGLCFVPRSVNNWAGAWLYAYPVGIPFHHDRTRHLRHHKRVGFRDDPDWVNYSNANRDSRARLIRFLAGRLLGALLVSTVWSVLVRGGARIRAGGEAADTAARGDWLRVTVCHALLFGAATLWLGVWAYPLLWLLPLATVASFCNYVRAFVEHNTEADEDVPVERRLRDYSPGRLEAAWFSPCHFEFHALHHAYPSIPHYRLPAARASASAAGRYPFTVAPGYLRSLREHLGRLPRRPPRRHRGAGGSGAAAGS